MKQKRSPFHIGFEQLENRRLLAADLGLDLSIDISADETMVLAGASHCNDQGMIEPDILESTATDAVEPVGTVLDLADGTDGMFGSLDAGNPADQMSFVAPDNGTASVVISSDFGDGDTVVEVRDGSGELVTSTSTPGLGGFQQISFDVDAGQTYDLTISTSEEGQGDFQLTVAFEADPPVEPQDLHVDEIGPDATLLAMVEGEVAIAGDLETDGDIDVFQFQAAEDGEVTLHMGEMTEGNQVKLNVAVYDSSGNQLLDGSTNEFVELKIDATAGETIYIAVSAGEGQTGAYNLHLQQAITDTVPPEPVDLHADEIGADATPLESTDGFSIVQSALETADDADAFSIVAQADGKATLELDSLSEGQTSNLRVSVFDDQGELLVEGLSNDDLSIQFDTLASNEYQILVDSDNDIPALYQMSTLTETGSLEPPVEDAPIADFDIDFDEVIADVDNDSDCDSMSGLLRATLDYSFHDRAMEEFGFFARI